MGVLVAVDPGLRGCGVAVFEDKRLTLATYVASDNLTERGPSAWVDMALALDRALIKIAIASLVVEYPQVYAQRSKGDPADLIEIAGVVGAISSRNTFTGYGVRGYLPREWKGQVPKAIHHARVWKALTPGEAMAFAPCPKRLEHNVWDAVALGLFELGRVTK